MGILTYKYNDTPEGEDCFPKMFYMAKNGAYLGLGVAVTDIMLLSHPKGYFQTAGRFIHFMAPFTAMAAAFAGTTCIANSIRGKDDKLNYVLGAFSSASIYGAWKKSLAGGLNAAVILGVIAFTKKYLDENNEKNFNWPTHKTPLFDVRALDYSGLKGKY